MADPLPPVFERADVTFTCFGTGYLARRTGMYPVAARLFRVEGGWSVSLAGVRFDSQLQVVAEMLPTLDAAAGAAVVALRTMGAVEERDRYRYRFAEDGPNRWYIDLTARAALVWNGRLPDLSGTDEAVRADRLPSILAYLDATFPDLVNLAQHRPHYDSSRGRTTDPNEHTVEVLEGLDTHDLTPRQCYLVRIAVLFHDVGKRADAFDPRHPAVSAQMAIPLLPRFGISPHEHATIVRQIREHDLLGVYSRGRMTQDEAARRLDIVDEPANLALHAAIARADIGAIRGLRWVVEQGNIDRAAEDLARRATIRA